MREEPVVASGLMRAKPVTVSNLILVGALPNARLVRHGQILLLLIGKG
jgi:hypothetical protein